MFSATIPAVKKEMTENVGELLATASEYHASDAPLFIYSYSLLIEALQNKEARVLEVCSGAGRLLIALARRFPKSDFLGIERYDRPRSGAAEIANVKFSSADAIDLQGVPDNHYDLVFGQATL
jgi:tRNA G46 methylase TrmB